VIIDDHDADWPPRDARLSRDPAGHISEVSRVTDSLRASIASG
jgi:hypothetical protein